MSVSKVIFQSYMKDPADHFATPGDVETHADLSVDEKIKILESWKLDEEELQVATDENMGGATPGRMPQVVSALNRIKQTLR